MRLIILLLGFFLCPIVWANMSFWQDQEKVTKNKNLTADFSVFSIEQQTKQRRNVRTLSLNETAFRTLLETAPTDDSHSDILRLSIQLPLPDGDFATLGVEESSVMAPRLAAKFPMIKTWKVVGDNKKVRSGRIDFTDKGFHAMLTMRNGDTTYIDPMPDTSNGQKIYQSMSLSQYSEVMPFSCDIKQVHPNQLPVDDVLSKGFTAFAATSGTMKTYRLAVAATSAFTAQNGKTKLSALAAIVTVINRINEIYQRDIAVKLVLVANNDSIIYTDASDDPYGLDSFSNLAINQINLDTIIGRANYDIGHVFDFVSTTSANGLAQVASVCDNNGKAKGSSGFMRDLDSFATSMVAHEIGHQFGATHSFNSNTTICNNNRNAATSYEPGSGTTIMSYAGICGSTNNIQNSTDPYFHSGSIQQMLQYSRTGNGASCATTVLLANASPLVEAGDSYTIPANTPIELKGSANESNTEDYLSYSWEQLNVANKASDVNIDDGTNAIFRVYPPASSSTRTIPNLINLYSGVIGKGDLPPQQSRLTTPLTMGLLVRDQKAGIALDTTAVFVKNTGHSFALTSHQTARVFSAGEAMPVNWTVADTHQPPIACSMVDIYLVTGDPRRGDTLVETLLARTDNDGDAIVTLPSDTAATQRARIKIKCSTNIFFALSPINFSIDDDIELSTAPITFSVANASSVEGHFGETTIKFTVVMSSIQTTEQTVFYTTLLSDTSSASAIDFKHINGNGLPVVFLPGETEKTVMVTVYGDDEIEADETFRFVLFNKGYIINSAIGTIQDDDRSPTTPSVISIRDATVVEGSAGEITQLQFVVQLDTVHPYDIDLFYQTVDNPELLTTSASAGDDYTAKKGVLIIPAGEIQGMINIAILGDDRGGEDENFSLVLSSPSANALLGKTTATGTIIDDDGGYREDIRNNLSISLIDSTQNSTGAGGSVDFLLISLLLLVVGFKRFRGYFDELM